MKRILPSLILAIVSALCLGGCAGQASIVGTWQSTDSGTLEKFDPDGEYSYTNNYVSEFGFLKGTWEKNEKSPTVNAEGKDWDVYIVTNETHQITGKADSDDSNVYTYSDGYGDLCYLVNGNDMYFVIGGGTLDRIKSEKTIPDPYKQLGSKRK